MTKFSRIEPIPGEGGGALVDPVATVEVIKLSAGGTGVLGDPTLPKDPLRREAIADAMLTNNCLISKVTIKA
jgi:hypothetical protein